MSSHGDGEHAYTHTHTHEHEQEHEGGHVHDPHSAERERHAQTIAALAMTHGHEHPDAHGGHEHDAEQHAQYDAGDITMASGAGDESGYGAAGFNLGDLDMDMEALGERMGVGEGITVDVSALPGGVGPSSLGPGAGAGGSEHGQPGAGYREVEEGAGEGDADGEGKLMQRMMSQEDDGRPLTEEDIRRKQNRSRAGGRVLPRGAACEFCKRRKLRCDAVKPMCNHCAKTGRACVYSQKKNKSRVKALEDKLVELQQRLQAEHAAEAAAAAAEGSPAPQSASANAQNAHEMQHGLFSSLEKIESLALPPMQLDPSLLAKESSANGDAQPHDAEQNEQNQEGHSQEAAFNAIYQLSQEQAAQAAADAAASVEALAEASEQDGVFSFPIDAPGSPERNQQAAQQQQAAAGSSSNQAQIHTRYLMTLANAAEVAADGPHTAQHQSGVAALLDLERQRAAMAVIKSAGGENLPVEIPDEIEARFSGARGDENKPGDIFANALINTFITRAAHYRFTRDLSRFRAAIDLPVEHRPAKVLLYAMIAAASVLPAQAMSKDMPQWGGPLVTVLAPYFLALAQREFVLALSTLQRPLDSIQGAAILAQVLYSQGKVMDGWMISSQGMNLAVSCGLHKLSWKAFDSERTGRTRLNQLERDVRRKWQVVQPVKDANEFGDRVHLFWSIYFVERIGSLNLGMESSISDQDICTPWPRPLEEYAVLPPSGFSSDSLPQLLDPRASSHGVTPVDTGLVLTLKSLALLVKAYRLYDLPEHLDSTNEREITQVAFDLFVNSLPDDYSRPPATGRHRKAFHPDHIWMYTCHYSIAMLLLAHKAIAVGASFDSMPVQSEAIEQAEHVSRLSKVILGPDVVRSPVAHFTLVWPIAGRFLLKQADAAWASGKTVESKGLTETAIALIESLRSVGKAYLVGILQAVKLEALKNGNELREGEWERQG